MSLLHQAAQYESRAAAVEQRLAALRKELRALQQRCASLGQGEPPPALPAGVSAQQYLRRLRRDNAALTQQSAQLAVARAAAEGAVFDTHAHYVQDERFRRSGRAPRLVGTVALMATHVDDWDAVAAAADGGQAGGEGGGGGAGGERGGLRWRASCVFVRMCMCTSVCLVCVYVCVCVCADVTRVQPQAEEVSLCCGRHSLPFSFHRPLLFRFFF